MILAAGLSAATFAWFWRRTQTDDCLAFWGSQAAFAIRQGETVELIPILGSSAVDSGADRLSVPTGAVSVGSPVKVTGEKGLVHGRLALVEDVGYRWDMRETAQDELSDPRIWDVAVRFQSRSGETATVLFDFESGRVLHQEAGKSLPAKEPLIKGWRAFVERHLRADR